MGGEHIVVTPGADCFEKLGKFEELDVAAGQALGEPGEPGAARLAAGGWRQLSPRVSIERLC